MLNTYKNSHCISKNRPQASQGIFFSSLIHGGGSSVQVPVFSSPQSIFFHLQFKVWL